MSRFTCVPTPDGLWTVWDDLNEVPATLGGKQLIGMPKFRAETARDVLERIEKSKVHAQSPRN
jgi:hypothetical protein